MMNIDAIKNAARETYVATECATGCRGDLEGAMNVLIEQLTAPKTHRFRVWWIPQVPGTTFYSEEVTTFAAAKAIDVTLGRYDIFQYENRIKPDFANAGGIKYWNADENAWVNIDESEYDDWEGK